MIKKFKAQEIPPKDEVERRLEAARARIFAQQMQLKEHKLPVLVLFEGWGASGKGSTIGKVIRNIDRVF